MTVFTQGYVHEKVACTDAVCASVRRGYHLVSRRKKRRQRARVRSCSRVSAITYIFNGSWGERT